MTAYDTILLGSTPNALVAAADLAQAGQRVLVLEPTAQLGGATSTTEFAAGFYADLGLTSGRIDPDIARDLQLHKHGLAIIERDSITSLLPDQRSFTLPADPTAATEIIRSFAPNDAPRYAPFLRLLGLASDLLRSAYTMVPPNDVQHPNAAETLQFASLVGQLRGYGRREMTEVMRLLVMSVRDLLDEWFENAELKGLLASVAIRGLTQGPFAGGTTFNLLHHLAIGDGYFRATAQGGVGAIVRALAAAAQARGATIRTDVGAVHVIVNNSVATGVRVGTESIEAAQIISDYDARQTFTKLVDPPELTPEFNRAVQHVRYNGAVARVNIALRELPEFPGLDAAALYGTLVIAPSVAQLERAFDSAKYGAIAEQPYIEASLPSLADPSLAPAGQHVLAVWLQYAPYRNQISAERVLELALARLSAFAPQLRALVLHSQVLLPHDFAAQFDLSEGHLYGGDMTLSQAFFLRPIPGYAQYHTPIEHLYVCGAATHPGGGISGWGGRNAANVVKH